MSKKLNKGEKMEYNLTAKEAVAKMLLGEKVVENNSAGYIYEKGFKIYDSKGNSMSIDGFLGASRSVPLRTGYAIYKEPVKIPDFNGWYIKSDKDTATMILEISKNKIVVLGHGSYTVDEFNQQFTQVDPEKCIKGE